MADIRREVDGIGGVGTGRTSLDFSLEKERIKELAEYEAQLKKKFLADADTIARKYLEKRAALEKKDAELLQKEKFQDELEAAEALEKRKKEIEIKEELRKLGYLSKEKFVKEKEEAEKLERYKKDIEERYRKATQSKLKNYMDDLGKRFGHSLKQGLVNGMTAFTRAGEKGIDIYAKYYSGFSTRLLDSGYAASDIFSNYEKNAALNPYLKLTTLLEKTANFIDLGITNNITQRAFLSSISDKIATTFDATLESLLEIIRILKEDTTAQRLGLEAELTRLFNHYFGDTSYLSKQFDNVQSILIGTSAQLGKTRGIEFEYQVQKWLGALGASGVSSNTLQLIATGINYLGTGNIGALSNNASLQNLLVMAANRGGVNYTNLLTGGMSSLDTNKLLYGLIDYVRSISGNNVVRAQYADLFGVSLTDMKVISELNSEVLKDLYKTSMSEKDMEKELSSQLNQVSGRMHLSEKISNLIENATTAAGMSLAGNPLLYTLYKATQTIEGITGGTNIISPTVLGTGPGLTGLTYELVIKTGLMGMGLMGPLMGSLNNLWNNGALNLSSYAISKNDGKGFLSGASGQLLATTSGTQFISNNNKTGTQQAIYDELTAAGETISGKNLNLEETNNEVVTILNFLKNYFETGGSSTLPLKVEIQSNTTKIGGSD